MIRRRLIGPVAFGMAVSLSVGAPVTSLAGTPEFGRSAEEWARLRDNVLEYEEIEDLVYEYNTTVSTTRRLITGRMPETGEKW